MTRSFARAVDLDYTDDPCDDVAPEDNVAAEDAATPDAIEDPLLASMAIDHALSQLPALYRALIELLYAYRVSPGYAGVWPPTVRDVSRYVSDHFYQGSPIPDRTLWRWHTMVLAHWHSQRIAHETVTALKTLRLAVPRSYRLRRAA
ncbi:MAG TPA: hypothetical protein VNU46_08840 [Gemmatimonadaceae bacterium]|jgi:hypothetical protein|nr:hypothetical protein [Gemmatimonadaceae bacterium]